MLKPTSHLGWPGDAAMAVTLGCAALAVGAFVWLCFFYEGSPAAKFDADCARRGGVVVGVGRGRSPTSVVCVSRDALLAGPR